LRLDKLRNVVKEAAQVNLIKDTAGDKVRILDNILDIQPSQPSIIIGTLFKTQHLKPSILNDMTHTI
jgi:hypothetical protein